MSQSDGPTFLPEDDLPTSVGVGSDPLDREDDIPTGVDVVPHAVDPGAAPYDLPTLPEPLVPKGRKPDPTGRYLPPENLALMEVEEDEENTVIHDRSSEETMVHDPLVEPLMPRAQLLVVEGVSQGKTYPLKGKEITFGREKENTIVHPDLSVSRQHFTIHYVTGSFVLEDLASSSGTFINDKQALGRVRLKHHDQIRAGQTVLEFVLLRQPSERSTFWLAGGLVGLVLALAILFLAVLLPKRAPKKPSSTRTPAQVLGKSPARRALKKGLYYKQEREWQQARAFFQKAKQLAPKNKLLQAQIRQLLKELTAEVRVEGLLQRAKTLYKEEKFKLAEKVVKQADALVPVGSPQAELIWSLSFRIKLRRSGRDLSKELQQAKALIKDKRWGEAHKKLKQLQGLVKIGTPEAKELVALLNQTALAFRKIRFAREMKFIETLIEEKKWKKALLSLLPMEQWIKAGTPEEKKTKEIRELLVKKLEKKPPPPRRKVLPFSQGTLFFHRGQLAASQAAFSRAKAQAKAALVATFTRAYMRGRGAYATRNPVLAIPALRKAHQLERRIGRGKSIFAKQIEVMLANMYYAKGRAAMSQHQVPSYAKAFTLFQQALHYQNNHTRSRKQLRQLREMAQGWLSRAQALGRSDEARQLLRDVKRVVSQSDPLYKQASSALKK